MLKDFIYFKGFKRIQDTGDFYELSCDATLRETVSKKIVALVKSEDGILRVPENIDEWFAGMEIAKLLAIVFRNPMLPLRLRAKLELLYKDGDPTNIRLTNTIWRCPEGKLTHPLLGDEFCYIPGYSRYLIARDGRVLSMPKGELLKPYMDANGYMMFGVQPDVGKRTIVGMHRLLALAYCPYDRHVDSLDVNHLDTDKINNQLDNLEWATRSRNNFHAHENGLNNSRGVLVRNIATGVINRYYSVEECGRVMGIDGETLRQRIVKKHAVGKVYSGFYQFKYEDDAQPWVIFDTIDEYDHVRTSRKVLARSVKTDEETVFSSLAEVGRFFDESPKTFQYQLSKSKTGIFYNGYSLEYVE